MASLKSIVTYLGEKFKLISLHLSKIALSIYKLVSYSSSESRQTMNSIIMSIFKTMNGKHLRKKNIKLVIQEK